MQKGFAPLIILIGIVAIATMAIGGVYYYSKSQAPKPQSQNPVVTSQTPQVIPSLNPSASPAPNGAGETANWKTYTNSQYRYSVKYSTALNQNDNQKSDTYLSSISFRGAETNSDWFNIVVRNSSLQDEIKYQKSQIEGHILAKLTKEKEITIGGFPGVLLEYTPDQPDNGSVTRFVIINNGKYSFIISGKPQTIDQILSTFKFTQ